MVIQRIQTLLLLLAVAAMAVTLVCIPVPLAEGGAVKACSNLTLLVLGCVAGALQLIDIFLFKDLKKQMLVANVAAVLVLAFIALGSVLTVNNAEFARTAWVWPGIVALASFILTLWAKARMNADLKLLRSADRLR